MTTSIQPQQPEDTLISKSQKKREMDALQDLGKTLAGLSTDTLKTMPIPDELREAIREYKRLNAHGALRRQMQYIGKLMRSVDAGPIEARLAVLRGESDQHTGWLHRLERWRERLLAEDKALDALLVEHPGLDVQTLRTHIRNARREQADNKPPKSYRVIFQMLKDIIPEPGRPMGALAAQADADEREDEA